MNQWIFHDPIYFWLLLPLAAITVWKILVYDKKRPSLQFSNLSELKKFQTQKKGWRLRFAHGKTLLQSAALVFVIMALARPQKADEKVRKNVEGIDIMICLDISDSMLIEDMKPLNRIEAAKDTLRRFVKSRSSDRIGLIIFAGEAYTMVPLTLDYELLLHRIDEITTAQEAHIKDGTAIGVALANAANRLKDSTAKSRVLIFATDGENNSGTIDPLTGLEVVKGFGIKVYSIGIGRDGPTRIPIYQKDVFGNKVKRYEPFDSTVNEDLLAKMASDTGGKYYRASREDSLQTVFAEIDSLEKVKIDINKFVRYSEEFPVFLSIAFLLYALGWLSSFTFLRRLP
jgi:Ca-activated chloride channel family protein